MPHFQNSFFQAGNMLDIAIHDHVIVGNGTGK
jgi:DNA repair protein RadC